jgi:hypothetical protein
MVTSDGKIKPTGHNLIKQIWPHATGALKEQVTAFKDVTGKSTGLELGMALWKIISDDLKTKWHAKTTSTENRGPAYLKEACDELLKEALDFAEDKGYAAQ